MARVSQRRVKELFLFKSVSIVFLHVCTDPELKTTILLQADVGVNDETTTTKAPVAARKEFARLQIGRQQQGWLRPNKASSLTLEGDEKSLLSVETDVFFALPFSLPVCFFSCLVVFLVFIFFVFVCFSCVCLQFSKAGTRGEDNLHSRMGAIGMRIRCVNCCTK